MNLNNLKGALIAIICLFTGLVTSNFATAQNNIVFQDDFEGTSTYAGWDGREGCCSYSMVPSYDGGRIGKKSLRIELRKSDPDVGGSKRAELTDNSYPIPPETDHRWWAFSNYLPWSFARDSVHEILAQWHDRATSSSVSNSPPLSLQIYKGNWILELRYDSVDINYDKGANIKAKVFNLGPWERGVWNDWVFNYNYSYNDDGYLKVWKNGKLVLDYKGKNFYKGSYDPFFKIGLYRWVWSSGWPSFLEQSVLTSRVYYVDNVKIGNKKAILQDFLIPDPKPTNISPVAYAGYKQTLSLPTNNATIRGTSSFDPDGSIAKYEWTVESGPSNPVLSYANTASLVITKMIQGTYIFRLTVTDNNGAKAYAKSIVQVTGSSTENKLPVVVSGTTKLLTLPTNSTTLSASGTYDPDGSIASYQWSQESGPANAVISNANTATPTVSSLVKGAYFFKLRATDNKGGFNTDYVEVFVDGITTPESTPTAPATNKKPVANAGSSQTFTAIYSTITMNGSASYDPDGYITKYRWTQESGPALTMSTPDSVKNIARGVVAGSYVFRLVVTDNGGLTDTSRLYVTVKPATTATQAVSDAPMELAMDAGRSAYSWNWPGKTVVLYPNPAQNTVSLNLNTPYTGMLGIEVYNPQGRLLYQERVQKSTPIFSRNINLGYLPMGTYLIEIVEGNKRLRVERIVKSSGR